VDYQTTKDIVAALDARKVSAVELLDRAIARIETHDGKINAVVVRDFERAREAAADADNLRARGERRPLLGVPMTVKEAFSVAGLPTTWGIPGTEQMRAGHDSVAVARLKKAGAVILGKTNVPFVLAIGRATTRSMASPINPWDLKRTLVDRREAPRPHLRPAMSRSRLDRTWSAHCGCLQTIAASSRTSRAMGWSRCEVSGRRTRLTSAWTPRLILP